MKILETHKKYSSHGTGEFSISDFQSIGKNVIFENNILVFNPHNIIIGDNVYIGHGTMLKAYIRNVLSIGNNTWIGQNCFFHSAGGIEIGCAVGIGPNVKILTSVHQEKELDIPVLYNPLEFKPVKICDGADIGIGTIILPGITIGYGAIVGAGSVVTKNVADYSVVAGNPIRLLRMRK